MTTCHSSYFVFCSPTKLPDFEPILVRSKIAILQNWAIVIQIGQFCYWTKALNAMDDLGDGG